MILFYTIAKNNSLSLFHLNVCSLSTNFDQLHNLLIQLNLELDFIGITETRLTSKAISPCNLSIENYIIEHTHLLNLQLVEHCCI